MNALRVLLTNISASGRSGTEIVIRDIALGLLRRGHHPFVYAQQVGPLALELRAASIPVVDAIDGISVSPDVIHGHHNPATATAVARFPDVPAIFVCHDFTAWHDAPPIFPSIRRYVAVDRTVADRLVIEAGIASERVEVQLNAVDLERFAMTDRTLPPHPLRALAFVKHTAHLEAVQAACDARGIALDVAGTVVGKTLDAPEQVLPDYDLVFTSALSALEAMASGCAVVVCDARGLAGYVTPETFERWRPYNFGLRTLTRPVTSASVGDEIDRYDAALAAQVTAMVRETSDMGGLVEKYVSLYETCIAEPVDHDRSVHDRALARHLERWAPRYAKGWPWMIERDELVRELDAALARPQRLREGDDVPLGVGHPPAVEFAGGFGAVEEWGVWTDGNDATIAFRVEDSATTELDIGIYLGAFVRPENTPLEVRVRANGTPVAAWSFSFPHAPGWECLRVPLTSGSGLVVLSFAIETPCSPHELGISADTRRLGLALHRLALGANDYADAAN